MFCRRCLYDLSHTVELRCPECGLWFNPRDRNTTLRDTNRIRWALHHLRECISQWRINRWKKRRMLCRECYYDLRQAVDDRCPICDAWFDRRDPDTYRSTDRALARVFHRVKHVCLWRGVIIPLLPLIYGLSCVITRHALLPGANSTRGLGAGARLMHLYHAPAIMMGIAWIGAATALHARYFWGRVEPTWRYADLGFYAGIAAIALGWGYALWYAVTTTLS